MKIKNKSLLDTAIISGLANMIVPQGTTIEVPSYFDECEVRRQVHLFPNLTLIEGSIVTREDLNYGNVFGHTGVMTKDVYDIDYNNIVDNAEHAMMVKSSLEIDFDFSDFTLSEKLIGTILAGYTVENTKIIVDTAFDDGQVTVGDGADTVRLAEASDNDLRFINTYVVEKSYTYQIGTQVKLYISGNPTVGSGKIVVAVS
jgi:hypothetical protein